MTHPSPNAKPSSDVTGTDLPATVDLASNSSRRSPEQPVSVTDGHSTLPSSCQGAAALQAHRPRWGARIGIHCSTPLSDVRTAGATHIAAPWPCPTLIARGVLDRNPTTMLEAWTWWWQAMGLDPEAAAVAATLQLGQQP